MKKILSAAALAVILSGCGGSFAPNSLLGGSSAAQSEQDEQGWRKYMENDGSMARIAFFSEDASRVFTDDNGVSHISGAKDGDKIGLALTKKNGGNVKLGDMYLSGAQSIFVTDLDRGGYYVNPGDKTELASLGESRNIKYYEFGSGLLETVVFSASAPVCKAYASGQEIGVRAVTNYYTKKTGDEFYSLTMNSVASLKNGISLKDHKVEFFTDFLTQKLAEPSTKTQNFMNKTVGNDLKKQERVLKKVCLID